MFCKPICRYLMVFYAGCVQLAISIQHVLGTVETENNYGAVVCCPASELAVFAVQV